jgi:hypothetical protein
MRNQPVIKMNKLAQYLIATTVSAFCSFASAVPATQPATPPAMPVPASGVLPVGVAKQGMVSMAWFVDTAAHQAVSCIAGDKICSRIVIPQEPNAPSSYVPVGVESFGSGSGAWLVDTTNKHAIICVHNQLRKDCTRMPYWP